MNIPPVGLGTWHIPREQTKEIVLAALNCGYTHLDCSPEYENQQEVGQAITEFLLINKRSDLFVVTKLWNTNHGPECVRAQLLVDLKQLNLSYVDLFLVHWPLQFKRGDKAHPMKDGKIELESGYGLQQTWKAMEALVDEGLVKFIGVSNFTVALVSDMLAYCQIRPAVNQVEAHVMFQNKKLIDYCLANGVQVTCYSPLGGSYEGHSDMKELGENEVLVKMANKYEKTVAQVLMGWRLAKHQSNISILPRTSKVDRLSENLNCQINMSQEDIQYLDTLDKGQRRCDPVQFWGIPIFE